MTLDEFFKEKPHIRHVLAVMCHVHLKTVRDWARGRSYPKPWQAEIIQRETGVKLWNIKASGLQDWLEKSWDDSKLIANVLGVRLQTLHNWKTGSFPKRQGIWEQLEQISCGAVKGPCKGGENE